MKSLSMENVPKIAWIRENTRSGKYLISEHVIRFLMASLLTIPEIETAIIKGNIIEVYDNPVRGISALVRGSYRDKIIFILCSKGVDDWLIISLTYLINLPTWPELHFSRPYVGNHMENPFRTCYFCGGKVDAIVVGNFDYRLEGQLYVIKDTPAGLCLQCGEKYITAQTAKKINALIEEKAFSGTEEVRVIAYS